MPARKPCPSCPWRKSTPSGGFPGGIIDAEGLLGMARGSEQKLMQCHCSSDAKPKVCVGFALQLGSDSLLFRLAVLRGLVEQDLATDEPLHTLRSLLEQHGGHPDP